MSTWTRLALSACLLVAAAPRAARGVSPAACAPGAVERLMRQLADGFHARTLAALDRDTARPEPLLAVVEHSIASETENEQLASFGALEAWLTAREEDGRPRREARRLTSCAKGLCLFEPYAGISHGALYLHHALYRCREGVPYLEAVFLLDGD